jgi:hypothetical protein
VWSASGLGNPKTKSVLGTTAATRVAINLYRVTVHGDHKEILVESDAHRVSLLQLVNEAVEGTTADPLTGLNWPFDNCRTVALPSGNLHVVPANHFHRYSF